MMTTEKINSLNGVERKGTGYKDIEELNLAVIAGQRNWLEFNGQTHTNLHIISKE